MRTKHRRNILEIIVQTNQVMVADIIELFNGSETTMRRVHGGAMSSPGRSYEPPHLLRATSDLRLKQAIGKNWWNSSLLWKVSTISPFERLFINHRALDCRGAMAFSVRLSSPYSEINQRREMFR